MKKAPRKTLRAFFAAAGAVAAFSAVNLDAANYTWQVAGTDDTWSNANWFVDAGTVLTPWTDANAALFTDNTGETITIAGTVTPTSLSITGNGNWTFQGTGGIAGAGTLTKAGTGTLTLLTNNTFTGAITINGGTIEVGTGGKLGTGAITIASGATLRFNQAAGITDLNATIGATSGAGTLAFIGGGTYAMTSATDKYKHQNTLVSGAGTVLQIGNGTAAGATGIILGTLTINNGAKVISNASNSVGYTAGVKINTVTIDHGTLEHQGEGDFGWGVVYNLTGAVMRTTNTASPGRFSMGSSTAVNVTGSDIQSEIAGLIRIRQADLTFTVGRGTSAVDLLVSAAMEMQDSVAANIVKQGAGIMVLAGANTYPGTTTVSAGTLQVGNAGTTGVLGTGAVTVASGATLAFSRSDAVSNSSVISGAGAIKIVGATSLDLTGNLTGFTGTLSDDSTSILRGGLNLSGGTATISGTVQPGGTSVGSMNFKNLTLNATSHVQFNLHPTLTSAANNDLVGISDTLTLNAGAKLDLVFSGTIPSDAPTRTYTLFSATTVSTSIVDLNSLLDSSLNEGRASYNVVNSSGTINLVVSGGAASLVWAGTVSGLDNFDWVASSNASPTGPLNWTNGGTADRFYTLDNATFNNTGKAGTIQISGIVKPGSLTVSNNTGHDYTFASKNGTPDADKISGATGLTKSGTGTLTILTNNDYTGAVTINQGTVQVGNGGTAGVLGGSGDITVNSPGRLVYNLSSDYTLSRKLVGKGTLVQNGTGNVTLASAAGNNHDINLQINSGIFTVDGSSWNANRFTSGNVITINNGGTLKTNSSHGLSGTDPAFSMVINAGGILSLSAEQYMTPGNLTMAGGTINATSGDIRFSSTGGQVQVTGTGSAINPTITLYGNAGFNVASGSDITVQNVAQSGGPYNLTKSGAGVLKVAGTSTYTGVTLVNQGTLWMSTSTPAASSSMQVAGGGVLNLDQGGGNYGTFALSGAGSSFAGHLKTMTGAPAYDINGSIKLSSGHMLSIGNAADVEVLSIAKTLTLDNSSLQFTIKGANTDVVSTGTLALVGSNTFQIVLPNGVITNGHYELITLTEGSLPVGDLTSITTSLGQGERVYVDSTGKKVILEIINGNSSLTWNGGVGGAPTVWNTSNINWLNESSTVVAFKNGDAVNFQGSGSTDVSITAEVKPTLVTVLGGVYTFSNTVAGKISGAASLRVQNATLTISGANTFTGIVEINDATVELTSGTTSTSLLANGGAASALGAGAVTPSSLVIDGGLLRFNATTGNTDTNRSFTIGAGGATLETVTTTANTLVRFTGTSAIAHTGTGDRTLTLTGVGGTGAIGYPSSTSNTTSGGVMKLSLTDPIDGKLQVVKEGSGVWMLESDTSTYTGGTVINGGMVGITSDRSFGGVPSVYDDQNIVMNGGYITNMYNNNSANILGGGKTSTLNAMRGIYIGDGGGGFRLGYSTNLTINGGVSGPGGIVLWDGNILTFNGVDTFKGGLTINAGTVRVGHAEAIPHGTGAGAVYIKTGTVLELMNVSAYIPHTYGGDTGDGIGTIRNGTGSTATTLHLGDGNVDFEFKGRIKNGTGTLGITKLGTAVTTLTLATSDTDKPDYSGPVKVEDGMLKMGNAAAFGSATNFTVTKGTLDIYGTSLDNTKTITIAGDGYSALDEVTQEIINYGALANTGVGTGTVTVAKIVLSDSARISTARPLTLATVSGSGDLTMSANPLSGGGTGTPGFVLPAAGTITLSPLGTATGQLIVDTSLTASNSANDAIKAPGGVVINSGGNVILRAGGGTTHIVDKTNAVTLKDGGLLTLGGNTTQILQSITGDSSGAGTVTHDNAAGSGTLVVENTATVSFAGKIGSSSLGTNSEKVNITKSGTGTFVLSNVTSDYTGITRVNSGVLELAGVLTITGGGTTGVLGSTATIAAGNLALDGGILRDTSVEQSYTNKLFTIGVNGGFIESTGTDNSGGLQFLNTGNIGFESAVVNATLTLGGTKSFSSPDVPGANLLASRITDTDLGKTSLRKTGVGMWVLSGANNTYTGDTLIQQGTLAIQVDNAISTSSQVVLGNAGTSGTLYLDGHKQTVVGLSTSGTGTGNRVIGGNTSMSTLTVANTAANTFAGALGGGTVTNANNFGLVKTSGGVLTLSGALAYTGDTEVQGGTLALAGSSNAPASTYTFVSDGAKLDVSGLSAGIRITTDKFLVAGNSSPTDSLVGSYALNGGTLWVGGTKTLSGSTTTITDTAATLQINGTLSSVNGSDSIIKYTFSESVTGANDLIQAGNLAFAGSTLIDPILSGGRLAEGTYTLFKYTTLSADGISQLDMSLLNNDARYAVTLRNDTAAKTIVMDVARKGTTGNVLYWVGSPNTQWGDPASSGTNFRLEGAVGQVSYSAGDQAVFDDSVTDAAKRNITVATGGVVLGSATFENSTGHDYTIVASSGAIGGTGTIEKYGTGKLTINNANTYSGGTFLGEGTLAVGHDQALGTGDLNLQGGTLQSSGSHTLANAFKAVTGTTSTIDTSTGIISHTGALTGDGTLQKKGSNALHFSGNGSAFTGTIKNQAGDIVFDSSVNQSGAHYELAAGTKLVSSAAGNSTVQIGSLSGDSTSVVTAGSSGTKTFEIGTNGDGVFNGQFQDGTGVVALTKAGNGTLTLTNASSNTGVTTVNGGVLEVGNGGSTGQLGSGAIQINSGGTLAFNRSNEVRLSQAIVSTGVLEQRGGSVLYIEANNTAMAGTVRVASGTLQIGKSDGTSTYADANIGTATIENNATLVYNLTGDYTVTNDMIGHGDLLKLKPGILTYLGNNYNTGTLTVDQGATVAIGNGTGTTDQVFSSTQIHLSNASLDLNPGSGTTLSIGGGVTGSGNVTKNGDGTAVLIGRTTASGTITINAGELHIGNGGDSGSVENSSILINTGAALAFNRTGTSVISARISGAGDIRQLGGNTGEGTVILSQDNLISGFISIENHSTLQVGDGGKSGSLNYDNAPVNVDVAEGATFAFNRTGSNLVTGSNLTITGAGNFEKRGAGTLTFNSSGQHTGGTIVREGRLIIETSNLPVAFTDPNGTGSLQAYDSGVLELRNGATSFDFEGRIGGTGTIALGASSSVGEGQFTRYNYKLTSAAFSAGDSSALGTLQVESRASLYLGTNPATTVQANTLNVLSGGKITGQGTIGGNLHNNYGGVVWIGEETGKTAAGQINVQGNFISEGRLDVALFKNADGTYAADTLHYDGSAQINKGSTVYFDITSLGGVLPENGTKINFVIDDDTSYNPLGSSVTGSFTQINPALTSETLIYNNGSGFTLLFAKSINDIPGLTLRDGLNDFVRYLDDVRLSDSDNPALNVVNGLLADENQSKAINNSSPIGLASMTSMVISMAHDDATTLRAHLESLRYDRAINGTDINIAPYFVATGSFARNGSGMSDPAFDYNTYGGLVGVDHSFSPELLVGVNAGYHHGTADLNDGGGKVKLDNARITAYGTYKFSDWVYVDAAIFGGYDSYEVNHTSVYGTATADPTGFDYGANVYLGTIVPFSKSFHLTPYVGVEYVRADVDGFTEKGTDAALRIDSFTQDSLRAKIGTGVNWIVPTGNDFSLRLALDLAYAYEILDTEADITGRYANDTSGVRPFKVNAASTPEHSVLAGPIAEFGFDGNKSISLSYSLEYDLEDQYIHHLNATFRMRF